MSSDESNKKTNLSDKKIYPSDKQPRKSVRLSDEQANNWDNTLVQWVLSDDNIELVRRVKEGNLVSSDNSSDEKIMVHCILEFQKLMSHARPRAPAGLIDMKSIKEGVKLAFQRNQI